MAHTLFTTGQISYKDNFTVVDVNRHGKPDLIVGNIAFSGTVSVFTNNGAGGFGINTGANLPTNFRP